MITSDLPSNDDLHAMFRGGESGRWVCWVYPVQYQDRPIKVWSRSLKHQPLNRQYVPLGCVEVDLG